MNDVDNKELQRKLCELMHRELDVTRELLSNLYEEQRALLDNDSEALKLVTHLRMPLMEAVLSYRQRRLDIMKVLSQRHGGADEAEALAELLDDDSIACEILSLRDRLLEHMQRIHSYATRNNYLIQNKVALTRTMINRLHPDHGRGTYSKEGIVGGKSKVTTITIINQEG